jgi:hypothetical protein
VKHRVASPEGLLQRTGIADVADAVLDGRVVNGAQVRIRAAKNPNGATFLEKGDGKVRSDKTGAASDKHVSHDWIRS